MEEDIPAPRLPKAYIAIHDKTPEMQVLYASSNIRDILQFEPAEVVGVPALCFVTNQKANDYVAKFGRPVNSNVLSSDMIVHAKDGTPVLLRITHFSFDSMEFNIAFRLDDFQVDLANGMNLAEDMILPGITIGQVEEAARAMGRPVPSQRRGMVRNYNRGNISNNSSSSESSANSDSVGNQLQSSRLQAALSRRCRRRMPVSTTRRTTFQGCLVLENPAVVDSTSPMGSRVVFASNSFEHIVGQEAAEIQGMAFLELIDPEDVARAARFLDRVAHSRNLEIERGLRFVRLGTRGRMMVEVLAAGSDDGAILLCQPEQNDGVSGNYRHGDVLNDEAGYMSLEEIVSSDPDTSEPSYTWRTMPGS
ncbi:hypothetical protein GGI07_005703 [Coemansia sp. Benny D115]|nr:hypothetical protein GGI07_005703 [Coemansia sp. Benny D115]